ncbi:hypothetical protein F511_09905 [Dorcoceras hygrometricum]|uniref:Uncharacterized protein n=1 Tax=Dorcoceras hygrometricum TaxID=472368 RepID=A0A2Z7C9N8_9LAMI|nr:hypothetical protein F511_09905 [Dorcoceras hygrometricum]
MATLPPSSLQLPKPSSGCRSSGRQNPPPRNLFILRAATDEDPSPTAAEPEPGKDDSFDNRLYQVRLRNRSGTGKKAELRKSKKGKKSGSGPSIFQPPVPLKEAFSEGLSVEFGFSSYAERIHGRLAILGLCALLSVELATGQGVISYHSTPIIFIQLYFVAAVSALYVKYEKEKISVWP